jgi:4-amino-4-deoxychorismate lyase
LPVGIDEAIFLNERDELCEGTITNLFLERDDGVLLTPPVSSGCLPGVLRRALLDDGRAQEAVLRPDDLIGQRFYMGNSLRGLIAAEVADAS